MTTRDLQFVSRCVPSEINALAVLLVVGMERSRKRYGSKELLALFGPVVVIGGVLDVNARAPNRHVVHRERRILRVGAYAQTEKEQQGGEERRG